MRKIIFCTFVAMIWASSGVFAPGQVLAASATGQIVLRVLSVLNIQVLAAMRFPASVPGAPEATIKPDSEQSGKFLVQGDPGKTFSIRVPREITLTTGAGGGRNEQIRVHQFESSPSGAGVISREGALTLSVGATRSALHPRQKDGVYVGSYTVEVIY